MLALADAQRAVATIAVFIATFLVTLSIGRLLKRRAGVPFGIFFQLFALTLGFYAAAWVYGFDLNWRNHAGAALVLLSTAVVIALVDRYLWDLYFEQRRQTVIPKFLRELVAHPVVERAPVHVPVADRRPDEQIDFLDGDRMLVSGPVAGAREVWDVRRRYRVARLGADSSMLQAVQLNPSGHDAALHFRDSTVAMRRWDASSLARDICSAAGRNLTCDEWRRYFLGQRYQKTCADAPAPRCDSPGS
jgi:hypothetical protein